MEMKPAFQEEESPVNALAKKIIILSNIDCFYHQLLSDKLPKKLTMPDSEGFIVQCAILSLLNERDFKGPDADGRTSLFMRLRGYEDDIYDVRIKALPDDSSRDCSVFLDPADEVPEKWVISDIFKKREEYPAPLPYSRTALLSSGFTTGWEIEEVERQLTALEEMGFIIEGLLAPPDLSQKACEYIRQKMGREVDEVENLAGYCPVVLALPLSVVPDEYREIYHTICHGFIAAHFGPAVIDVQELTLIPADLAGDESDFLGTDSTFTVIHLRRAHLGWQEILFPPYPGSAFHLYQVGDTLTLETLFTQSDEWSDAKPAEAFMLFHTLEQAGFDISWRTSGAIKALQKANYIMQEGGKLLLTENGRKYFRYITTRRGYLSRLDDLDKLQKHFLDAFGDGIANLINGCSC